MSTNNTIRLVELRPHDPAWAKTFTDEANYLAPLFGENLIAMHHIGSTAVFGIQAKPIIDMMPIVWNIEQVDNLIDAMHDRGYIHKGENGIPGRRYFRKGSDQHHSHHIHVYQTGNAEIARHLLFRDYLRAHSNRAQAYNRLKTELAETFKYDTAAYTSAKSDFIQAINLEAVTWYQERERPLHTLNTPRLQLIALSQSQLASCLLDASLLAINLALPLEDNIFHSIVRQAVSIKLSKMRLAAPKQHPWYTYWLIVHRDKQLGIGTIGFKGEPDLNGAVEIGYGMSPGHRQNGFMTEAVGSLTTWALSQQNCTAVFAMTEPANIPSHRVLEKTGMKRTGENNGEWRWEMRAKR